ncbi:MAG TPA: COR domain-containing protein, partial [Gemmata sp.]
APGAPAPADPGAALVTFLQSASAPAVELAVALSGTPVITLPVIRLLAETLSAAAGTTTQAEVWLGGLLEVVPETARDADPDRMCYTFRGDTGERLERVLTPEKAQDIQDRVTAYFEREGGWGRKALRTLRAMIEEPATSSGGEHLGKTFARIAARFVRRHRGTRLDQLLTTYQQNPEAGLDLPAGTSDADLVALAERAPALAITALRVRLRAPLTARGCVDFAASLPNLTRLDLSDSEALSDDDLHLIAARLPALRHLVLGRAEEVTGAGLAAVAEALTGLRTLVVEACSQVTSLPESFQGLTHLRELRLRRARLSVLPEWLGQLSQLRVLSFSGNRLSSLPDSLGQLTGLQTLSLSSNRLSSLPDSLGQLTGLQTLHLDNNQLPSVPESLGQLTGLQALHLDNNQLPSVPESLGQLTDLQTLHLRNNQLSSLPESLGQLAHLQRLHLYKNQLSSLPDSLGQLTGLQTLHLSGNPLNPELAAVYKQGTSAVLAYLQTATSIVLNEAKLVLVGEGEVGKSSLLGALRGDPWDDSRATTHGIEIKPVVVTAPDTGTPITLNAWDFGGQRVYRPTLQLFFSAPALYLVVWKSREGPLTGQVKEWIKLVKYRAPEAKIFVVATHGGGARERPPVIDHQEIWDLFGTGTVAGFFNVESRPAEESGTGRGIAELRDAIARVAAALPGVGRTVPRSWRKARAAMHRIASPYLSLAEVRETCRACGMDAPGANLFVSVSHQLGHLIHYAHDPVLRDIVVLKPDWLATAISFVLDDKETRERNGLVSAARLAYLWNDPARRPEFRYPADSHPFLLRLMERYDLAYPVPDVTDAYLIGQLVPDVRPEGTLARVWPAVGEGQSTPEQVQVCKIVVSRNRSAAAEGLLYQLIVRLHKYSLGRAEYANSVHWQRGVVLEDAYGSRALLEHVGNDIRITVRAPYPERFLAALTFEVKHLVESFWKDLRCLVMVPCLNPKKRVPRCAGLFEVEALLESRRRHWPDQPCPVCNEWQSIEELLRNAPAAQPDPLTALLEDGLGDVKAAVAALGAAGGQRHAELIGRFDQADATADARDKAQALRVEAAYDRLMHALVDEAKEGPRLFHLEPVNPGFFDLRSWVSERFRITLWCEHARLPLPVVNAQLGTPNEAAGVYEVTIPRQWLTTSAPYLKGVGTVLGLVVPLAGIAAVAVTGAAFKLLERQLDAGRKVVDSVLRSAEPPSGGGPPDHRALARGAGVAGAGPALRQLHAWLKEKDPGFGGLVRVLNTRGEFLWVHPHFAAEY